MHLQQRIVVTGGSGFLGSHLCDRLLAQGAEVICIDNFFTGARRNIEHLIGDKRFELVRHDVTFPIYLGDRPDLQSGLSGVAHPLPARPGADDQNERAWRDQHARACQARESKNPASLHIGSLWRPDGASADGGLLGPRQSDRPALLL